jgi:hypothetical protein
VRTGKKRKIAGKKMVRFEVLIHAEAKKQIEELAGKSTLASTVERMASFLTRRQQRRHNTPDVSQSSS